MRIRGEMRGERGRERENRERQRERGGGGTDRKVKCINRCKKVEK